MPRFNPHGYQAPPQEKRKEVPLESYSPLRVSDKIFAFWDLYLVNFSNLNSNVQRTRTKLTQQVAVSKDTQKFSIEELLLSSGVEYRNPDKVQGGWLPLEAFDDSNFDAKPVNKIGTGELKTAAKWC